MTFEKAARMLAGVPHIVPDRAHVLYDFVLAEKPARILELGFAHGVSTCYMAAALEEIGGGKITTIDIPDALGRKPDLKELLERTKLGRFVEPIIDPTSYTWALMEMVEAATVNGECRPCFDFIFVDGAHSWDVDGFAFFLSEKLLKPGGWFLFDDMYWSYDEDLAGNPSVATMPDRDRHTPQIDRVFHLLGTQHPNIDQFRTQGNWGWARKRPDAAVPRRESTLDSLYEQQGIGIDIRAIVHKFRKRITIGKHSTLRRGR